MSVEGIHPGKGMALTARRPERQSSPGANVHRRRVIRPVSRAYSRLVALMKLMLPVLALGLLALLVAWPALNVLPKPHIDAEKGKLEMVRPRYFSADEHNQPYSVSAATAVQSADQQGIVVLESPESEMSEKAGTWVTIKAERGWYDQNTGILKMRGSVHVMRDDGNEFTTDEAFSDVRKGTAWGDVHVEGQGPQGEIRGDGFRMTERGRNVVFLHGANAAVQQGLNSDKAGAAPSADGAPATASSASASAPSAQSTVAPAADPPMTLSLPVVAPPAAPVPAVPSAPVVAARPSSDPASVKPAVPASPAVSPMPPVPRRKPSLPNLRRQP